MRQFISYILSFVYDTMYELHFIINAYVNTNTNKANVIGLSTSNFNLWLDKNIINGDLITIGLTWRELLLYVVVISLIIFFIVIFVRLVFKVIGLICLR